MKSIVDKQKDNYTIGINIPSMNLLNNASTPTQSGSSAQTSVPMSTEERRATVLVSLISAEEAAFVRREFGDSIFHAAIGDIRNEILAILQRIPASTPNTRLIPNPGMLTTRAFSLKQKSGQNKSDDKRETNHELLETVKNTIRSFLIPE